MPTIGGLVVGGTGIEKSGRTPLREVIDELARPVNVDDSTVRALASEAFRAAVRVMNRRGLWPWEILDEDLNITAGNPFATATGAIKKPLAMHYLNGAGGTPDERIAYTPYDIFLESYTLDISGHAHTYTVPNMFESGQVRFFPVPDSNDYARMTYYRVTAAPKTEEASIEVPDWALEVYKSFAWVEFLKRLPPSQQAIPLAVAMEDARQAFKQLSAIVASPGDRTREGFFYG